MASLARPSDRWIPWYFVIFFVLLALLLGSFCWIAVHTYTGEVTEDGYKKGLRYNEVLKAADQEAALGWKSTIEVNLQGRKAGVMFHLSDARGNPLDVPEVEATYVRPTQAGYDVHTRLKSTGAGLYKGEIQLPLPGLWELHITATQGTNHYQAVKTIVTQ